jgi:phosphatidylglycerophosphatase A
MNLAMASTSPNSDVATLPAGRDARALATVLGIGYLKPGSGTWASAVTALAWAGIAATLPPSWRWPVATAAAAFVTFIGIPAATRVARADRDPDPGHVVIDEVAGQLIALIAAPLGWKSFLAGFILFRAFDIVKPPPVRQLEKLPEGTGIMVDDVGAGLYALIVLQLLLHYGWLS